MEKPGISATHSYLIANTGASPQNREGYIVVGTLDSLPDTYTYPEEQHDYVPKLSTILEADVDDKFYIADEKAHKIIDQALQRISSMGKVHATITPDRVE